MATRRSPLQPLVRQARAALGVAFRPENYSLELSAILHRTGHLGPYRTAIKNRIERGRAVGTDWIVTTRNGGVVWEAKDESEARAITRALNEQRTP
jgi:hypothetical protein